MSKISIIGGSNVDYIAKANCEFKLKDSNTGSLNVSFGGVGRNIAENLTRLGNSVNFFTALGNDAYGIKIKEELEQIGCKVYSPITNYPSSSYIAIHSKQGDMEVALCDSRVMDELKEEYLEQYIDIIKQSDLVLLEANLSEQIIDYLFKRLDNVKICIEGVSCPKVIKFKNYLDKIYLFKSNNIEVKAITNLEDSSLEDNVKYLLNKGVKKVVVSNGEKPIIIGENNKVDQINIVPLEKVVSATGAGDALYSGIIDQILKGKELKESCLFGDKVAKLTLLSLQAVNKDISKLNKE